MAFRILGNMQAITADEYVAVTRRAGYNIILATAPWCHVCSAVKPKLAALLREGVSVYTIDVEQHENFSDSDSIRALPTMFVYHNGHPKLLHSGGDITPIEAAIV